MNEVIVIKNEDVIDTFHSGAWLVIRLIPALLSAKGKKIEYKNQVSIVEEVQNHKERIALKIAPLV